MDSLPKSVYHKQNEDLKKLFIKEVAIYLRKSRGDEEQKDLENHKKTLIEICEKEGWKYTIYSELESAATIEMRPEMQKLLSAMHDGEYDAVQVMDIDRLIRGEDADAGIVKRAFRDTNTKLIELNRVMDLGDDTDEITYDMKAFIARMEYNQIVKRFKRGKKRGAADGYWTNGIPPFPYEYKHNEDGRSRGSLIINQQKRVIYDDIKKQYIVNKKTLRSIAIDLNNRSILSPKGGCWSGVTVGRLLTDETHMGLIVINKSRGNGHKKRSSLAKPFTGIDKDEWIKYKGKHEAIKTIEEHEAILIRQQRDAKVPRHKSGAKRIFPFTGLIKCAICGHNMSLQERKDYEGKFIIKKCWYINPYGEKCENRGGSMELVNLVINNELASFEDKIITEITGIDESYLKSIESSISEQKSLLIRKKEALNRIDKAYEEGVDTFEEYQKKKTRIHGEIKSIENEIAILNLKLKHYNVKESMLRLNVFKEFQEKLKQGSFSDEELNALYKTIIERITWNRVGDDVTIEVSFL